MIGYDQAYANWQADPVGFWEEAAKAIEWIKPADQVFDPTMGQMGRWFAGATCNTCWNAVDRHVRDGRGAQTALIWDSPVTGAVRQFSFAEMLDEVSALAGVMQERGVTKGDRVLIYMPMVAEAVFAMLACARLGAVHSVVFGGFAAHELAVRIDDAAPKMIISASCGIETKRIIAYKPLLDEAIEMAAAKPDTCLILQRDTHRCGLIDGRDIDYAESIAQAKASGQRADCVEVAATDPLYILYTSGTTGQPKGVVRDNGGHMVALRWTMNIIMVCIRGMCSGRPRTWAGSSGIPTSATALC